MEEQREYDNLRKEIECSMDVVRKASNALYVGITAVFAWAITMHSSAISLLAYCVTIPVYFIVLDYNISIMRTGAYLLVFHNDKWEKRFHEMNMRKVINRHASSYRNPFIYASIATTILFLCFWNYRKIGILEALQLFFCIILFLWFNIYVFSQKGNDAIKQKYIDEWKEIKRKEE